MVLNDVIKAICNEFFQGREGLNIQAISGGLINKTYKISFSTDEYYVLQELNTTIFKNPSAVMANIQLVANHLKNNYYPLKNLEPVKTQNGRMLIKDRIGNYWRAFPFIESTLVFDKVSTQKQAFEAAKAFGLFIKHLDSIDPQNVKITIPDFHNLELRTKQFLKAIKDDPFNRKKTAEDEIKKLLKYRRLLDCDYKNLQLRIIHNDAKIRNVLFDEHSLNAVCVIDLDTVMPGYVISDFGDMIRTMCCTASEEEKDLSKVKIDKDLFGAVAEGFLIVTHSFLTNEEKEKLVAGGVNIIFEQAIRFLTDYLKGDEYYSVQNKGQNLNRARNQLKLFESLLEIKPELELYINGLC